MDILTYALAKSYTDKALLGVGTIKGAPCTVKSQTEDDEYVYVTLGWENSLGTSEETVVKIKKGADGAPGEPGPAGDPGPQGISITKIEKIKTEDLIDTYQISFSDNTTFEYTISNGSTDYLNITNKPSIEGVELTGNKTFKDLNIASADALTATDENLQNLSNLIGDKTSLPAPTDTVVNNIASVDAKVDAIIDDNETGLAKTFSSDKITKTFATLEEVNERIPQYDVLPAPTEAFGGKVVQFIGATTEDYVHNYFYECTQVEGNYKWVNVAVQNIPTKVSELTNDSNFVTETELNAKGYLTEHQDLSAYATKEEIPTVPSKVSELSNDSNYQTAEQVNSTVTTEIAKIVADAPEDLNTLKEMSDWIAGHEDNASAMNSAISDNKTAITALQTGKADKSEIPTSLPANGGNADTVNKHTVKSDVPENAVFTDTVYDDTEVKGSITELSSNLNSEIGRAKEADEILKSRVDSITSLPEGSTTGDAELLDIRVKADGTTATSAGNAVREQVSELKSDIDNLSNETLSIIKQNEKLDFSMSGYYTSEGVYAIDSDAHLTDFIYTDGLSEIFFASIETSDVNVISYFDANKNYISGIVGNGKLTSYREVIPDTAKYIRAGYYGNNSCYGGVYSDSYIINNKANNVVFINGYRFRNGAVIKDEDFALSIPVKIKPNQILIYNGCGYDRGIDVISISNENGDYVDRLVNAQDTTIKNYNYRNITNEDIWVRLTAYISNNSPIAYVKDFNENEDYSTLITFASEFGYYDSEGIKRPSTSDYKVSKEPITIYRGETISVTTYAEPNQVCPISSINESTGKVLPVIVGDTSSVKTYTYTCNTDCERIYVSFETNLYSCFEVSKSNSSKEQSLITRNKIEWATNRMAYMYGSCICIGDSITEGNQVGSNSNYPLFLQRMSGMDVINAGVSGASASSWWNLKKDDYIYSNYDMAIIFLGTNYGLTDTIEEDTTISTKQTYLDYADTNTGRYCSIIEHILNGNPSCKIFIGTIYVNPENMTAEATNIVINKIAQKYSDQNVKVFDMHYWKKYRHDTVLFPIYKNGVHDSVHMGTMGYNWFARAIMEKISTVIDSNSSDYKL